MTGLGTGYQSAGVRLDVQIRGCRPLGVRCVGRDEGAAVTSWLVVDHNRIMANTSSRALQLLSLLQTHRHWPGPELADRLGVSPRTLRRDVDRLRDLGYPVDAAHGVERGYELAPGATLPPLVVDDDEAVALAVGMQAVAQGAVAGVEEPAVRALTKVVQVMPPRLRKRVDALRAVTVPAVWNAGPALDPDALIAVASACRDHERLEFAYARTTDPPPTGSSSRTGWCRWVGAGTWWRTTCTGTPGAASGWTGSLLRAAPAPGSGREISRPRTPRPSSGKGLRRRGRYG